MRVMFLTSGFPDGFTDDFAQSIKEHYRNRGSLVFLASDFALHSVTDKYSNLFVSMFEEKGITFEQVHVVDNRIAKIDATHLLEKADVVWISGGDTLKQIHYIKAYDLISTLQKRTGITIGMSAGSINMAKRVVLPKDPEDNIPELSIYDGIGLVDINIEPHFDTERKEHLKHIKEAAKYATIYGLFDNSFVKIIEDIVEFYGEYDVISLGGL